MKFQQEGVRVWNAHRPDREMYPMPVRGGRVSTLKNTIPRQIQPYTTITYRFVIASCSGETKCSIVDIE